MFINSDLDFNSVARLKNLLNAVSPQEPVTLAQLQAAVEGLAWKDDVVCAASANVNIASPGATVDGVTMVANNRVLLKAQTAGAENGVYLWNGAAVAMTRALDMNASAEFNSAVVPVKTGTSAGSQWRCSTIDPTVGTTSIAFATFGTAAPSASESTAGIAELATQAETDAGTDDLRIVTPLKLKTSPHFSKKYATTVGDGSATSIVVTHNLGTRDVSVQVVRNSGAYDAVLVDWAATTINTITLTFAAAPASNAFRAVVWN